MSKNKKRILILPGDGIGPEVSVVAKKTFSFVRSEIFFRSRGLRRIVRRNSL